MGAGSAPSPGTRTTPHYFKTSANTSPLPHLLHMFRSLPHPAPTPATTPPPPKTPDLAGRGTFSRPAPGFTARISRRTRDWRLRLKFWTTHRCTPPAAAAVATTVNDARTSARQVVNYGHSMTPYPHHTLCLYTHLHLPTTHPCHHLPPHPVFPPPHPTTPPPGFQHSVTRLNMGGRAFLMVANLCQTPWTTCLHSACQPTTIPCLHLASGLLAHSTTCGEHSVPFFCTVTRMTFLCSVQDMFSRTVDDIFWDALSFSPITGLFHSKSLNIGILSRTVDFWHGGAQQYQDCTALCRAAARDTHPTRARYTRSFAWAPPSPISPFISAQCIFGAIPMQLPWL